MVSTRTVVLRKMTQAQNPHSFEFKSSKRSESSNGEELEVEEKEDDYYDDTYCENCGLGHKPAELLLCDKCDRGFHIFCLRPILVTVPKGSWFCPSCADSKKVTSMFNFFIYYFIAFNLLYYIVK